MLLNVFYCLLGDDYWSVNYVYQFNILLYNIFTVASVSVFLFSQLSVLVSFSTCKFSCTTFVIKVWDLDELYYRVEGQYVRHLFKV